MSPTTKKKSTTKQGEAKKRRGTENTITKKSASTLTKKGTTTSIKKTLKQTIKGSRRPKKKMVKKASTSKVALDAHEEEEGDQPHKIKTARTTVKAIYGGEQVLTEETDAARDLYSQSRFGEPDGAGRIQLSVLEALYLLEKGKIKVSPAKGRAFTVDTFTRRLKATNEQFWTRYQVYRDMRSRGYIVKTALKFGADFRVYDRGVKPGEDHAKWVLFPIHESQTLTWYDFAAKNRVAHSTKKRLLLAIVDEEGDVTYYEVNWKRP